MVTRIALVKTAISQGWKDEDLMRLNALLAATPEATTRAKWIRIPYVTGERRTYSGCSACGAARPTDCQSDFLDISDCEYCYSCGAKMEFTTTPTA